MGFMTGRKIYENFANGVGPEGLSISAAIVSELAAEYQDEGEAIRRLTAKMESVWQGDAAGAAQRGAGPLATEHELAAPHMATAQDLDSRQAGSFTDARNAVVPVPAEPTPPDPWVLVTSSGVLATYRQQVADYNAATQHNVDVMTGYTSASSYNTTNMPQSYGSLAGDQAGITIDTGTGDPRLDGPEPEEEPRGAVEWPTREAELMAPPDTGGEPPSPGGTPTDSDSGPVPQQTTPDGFAPTPSTPSTPVHVSISTGLGSGPPSGGPSGLAPGTGLGSVGGGPGDHVGGRGPGNGPGGRGAGVPGPGSGPEVRGPDERAGEPRGPGGRVGAGPPPGAAGEPHAAGRGAAGGAAGRGSGVGGMPLVAGGRGRGAGDVERYAPEYLREADPDAVFGADEPTAPPVIGAELELDEQPSAG